MDHLIEANMSIDKTGDKGTRKGRPNYKSSILLKVVRSILPASKLGWEEVAEDYKLSTKEEDLRGYEDVKRHEGCLFSVLEKGKIKKSKQKT